MNKYKNYAYLITDKYITIMLLIFPVFTGFSGYSNITFSKYLFFSLVTSTWLLLIATLTLLSREKLKPKIHEIIAIALLLWSAISALASPFGATTIVGASRYDGLFTTLLYIGIFLAVGRYGRFDNKYLKYIMCSTIICAIIALMQLFGSSILFPNGLTYYDGGVKYISRFLGTIGNTNMLAAFFCLAMPLLAAAFSLKLQKWYICLPACAMATFILIVSESSGGLLALLACALVCAGLLAERRALPRAFVAVAASLFGGISAALFLKSIVLFCVSLLGIIIALLFAWLFEKKIDFKEHKKIINYTILCSIIIGFAVVYFWQGESGAVYELSQILHGNVDDSFGSRRIEIWREAIRVSRERIMLGGGPDTFALRTELTFSRYSEEYGRVLTSHVDNTHNVYLGYLVNIGLPGLMIYLSLIGATVIRVFRKNAATHVVLLFVALSCAWVENLFGLGLSIVAPIMWLLWGLSFSEPINE